MKIPVTLSQRGKYLHRAYGPDGRLIGVINAGDPPDRDLGRYRTTERPLVWYAHATNGTRHGGLPDLERAVRALVEHHHPIGTRPRNHTP